MAREEGNVRSFKGFTFIVWLFKGERQLSPLMFYGIRY